MPGDMPIVRTLSWSNAYHRASIHDCPHCDFRGERGGKEWEKTATMLVLDPVDRKHAYVVVVSQCPKCEEASWLHYWMESFGSLDGVFPAKWLVAVAEELAARKAAAMQTWKASLCRRCAWLTKKEITTLAHAECEVKKPGGGTFGHMGEAEAECPNFRPLRRGRPCRKSRRS